MRVGNKSATGIQTVRTVKCVQIFWSNHFSFNEQSTDSAGTTIMFNLDLMALSQDTTRQAFQPLESFTEEEPRGSKPRPEKKPVDPENIYNISRFSSFTPSTIVSRSLLKKRKQKEAYREIEGFKARKSARIFESKSRDIAKDTKPRGKRAGNAGIPLKKARFEEEFYSDEPKLGFEDLPLHIPRSEATDPLSTSSTPASLPSLGDCPSKSALSSAPYDKPLPARRSGTRTGLRSGKAEQQEEMTQKANALKVQIEEAKEEAAKEAEAERRESVERNLISLVPSIVNFKFSHRNGDGTATSYIDKSRRSFATRTECPAGMSSAADLLSECIAKATTGANALRVTYPRKARAPRGGHEIRQVGVHRELGSDVGYSKDFRAKIKKWVPLFNSTGMTRVRNHISRKSGSSYKPSNGAY